MNAKGRVTTVSDATPPGALAFSLFALLLASFCSSCSVIMDAAGVTAVLERARNVLGFLVLTTLTREDRVGGSSIQVTDNGNQTIMVGSLLWSRCANGQSTDDCGGAASIYAYCNAQNNTCNGDADQGRADGQRYQRSLPGLPVFEPGRA